MSTFTLDDINNKNKILQKNALMYYSQSVTPEEISKLEKVFNDNPKSEAGLMAAIILGKNGNKEVIEKILIYLQDRNYSLQRKAELVLTEIGKNAVEPLVKYNGLDEDRGLLMRIAKVLRNMSEINIPLMLKMIEGGTLPMQIIAAFVLGRVKNDDKVLVTLIKALANNEPELDRVIIESLVEAGDKIVQIIQKVFKNCNEHIAEVLMEVLYRIGQPALKLLIECLDSPTLHLRRYAPYAIRFAKDADTIKKVIDVLNDSDYIVCYNAYRNLVENLTEEHKFLFFHKLLEPNLPENQLHWLIKTLCSKFDEYSEQILLYMKTPEEVKPSETPMSDNVKISLAIAIADFFNSTLIARLIKMLGDQSYFVRENAIKILVENGRMFIPQIIMALGDPREDVRDAIIRILKVLKDHAFGVLLENLKTGNNEMRYNCAYALGYMEDKRAADQLTKALNDGNDWVREFAAASLGRLGEINSLLPLLNDNDEQSRAQIIKALGLCGKNALAPLIKALGEANIDKREGISKAVMALGPVIKDDLQMILETEENENVRFWLLKIMRSFSKKNEM
ncbi:MAG: HEAT repeat domain-containing protein [Candidatus Wallbacteria bacterium]